MRYTDEELTIAKQVDMCQVASAMGYTIKKIGKYYTVEEMDSIRIYPDNHWCRFSQREVAGKRGGSSIDFLMIFGDKTFREAVQTLLDYAGYQNHHAPDPARIRRKEPEVAGKNFTLPVPNDSNRRMYGYLIHARGLKKEVIDIFARQGLIYEEKSHHNIVFLGNDPFGKTRFASMRGTYDSADGRGFRCDVAGNDKNYGFNLTVPESEEVVVFEAAIDLMSYVELFNETDVNLLALGMLADLPLVRFLEDHKQIRRIKFAFDNDEKGQEGTG